MSEDGSTGETLGGRRDNGLNATSFFRLSEVDPRVSMDLLETLGRASIAAYTTPSPGRMGTYLDRKYSTRPLDALYVDGSRVDAARAIVDPLVSKLAIEAESAAFDEIVAGFVWDEPEGKEAAPAPTPQPVVLDPFDGPRDFSPAPESEHWDPPTPRPAPKVHPTTRWAWASLAVGVLLLISPTIFGFDSGDGAIFLGTVGVLVGIGLLVSRLRDDNSPEDGNDDGAVV